MTPAAYLIQSHDGALHGYWCLDVLLIDLRTNGAPAAIFRKVGGWTLRYVPATEAELRAELGAA